jgi:hypothetical protein
VSEQVVFQNRRNDAEKVTVTEIECDHSCSWDAALAKYTENAARDLNSCCAFYVCKDNNGRPDWSKIFLALPIDRSRVQLCFPSKVNAGIVPNSRLFTSACFFNWEDAQHRESVAKVWQREYAACVAKKQHLESFALLNGSVFSIWYNVRKALDPRFNPDQDTRSNMEQEATGRPSGGGRYGRSRGYTFEPNVKIQLVTTSSGQRLGGIRLSTTRPWVHKSRPWNDQCNRRRAQLASGSHTIAEATLCRRRACLVEGYNEVDKLVKGLAKYSPSLS